MSASAWDRAVEAAAEANGQTEPLAARYRESIEQALAAALPVLLKELAQRIEDSLSPLTSVRKYAGGYDCCGCSTYDQIVEDAAGIVRGFAAEVTK